MVGLIAVESGVAANSGSGRAVPAASTIEALSMSRLGNLPISHDDRSLPRCGQWNLILPATVLAPSWAFQIIISLDHSQYSPALAERTKVPKQPPAKDQCLHAHS